LKCFFLQFTEGGSTRSSDEATVITTTITIVLFSTIVFGTATKPLIGWLLPARLKTLYREDSDPPSPKDISVDSDIHVPLLFGASEADQEHNGGNFFINGLRRPSSITALLGASTSGIHRVWRNFDDAYMRPLFGGRGFVRQVSRRPTIPEDEPFEDSNSEE
jgi:sodium/hydrogen exchanger 8